MTTPSSAPTEIFLLGTVAVSGGGRLAAPPRITGPALELFAYFLTCSHRALTRDHLADLLWEDRDSDRSRAALNTALWRVRQALRRLPGVSLRSEGHRVLMELDAAVRLDTEVLRKVVSGALASFSREDGLPSAARCGLVDAIARFEGSFLDGSNSSWVLVEREEYFNLRLRGLTMLMQDAGIRSMYEDALAFGRRILALDPFREAVQCEILWLYMMTGQRAFAIRHYREYEQLLKRELGISPMAETRAVYELICSDAATPIQPVQLLFGEPAQRPEQPAVAVRMLGEIGKTRRAFYRSHFATGA